MRASAPRGSGAVERPLAALFIAFFAAACCAAAPKRVGCDFGIATGIPLYGGGDVEASNSAVNGGSVNRIVIGGNADITLRLGEPLKLLAGTDILCDFVWSGGDHSNHLDYAFFGGIKAYPGIRGLALSVAYAIGRRTDFIDNEAEKSAGRSTSWGNGFRISAEYDFLHNSARRCMPAVGIYYRMMPRGGGLYDNIIAAYAVLSL